MVNGERGWRFAPRPAKAGIYGAAGRPAVSFL